MVPESATAFSATVVFLSPEVSQAEDYLRQVSFELHSISDSFFFVSTSELHVSGWKHISQKHSQTPLQALLKVVQSEALIIGNLLAIDYGSKIELADAVEILSVLNLAEKHGVVGTRSPQPGQGQVPAGFAYTEAPEQIQLRDSSEETFLQISNELPRYSVVKETESPVIGLSQNALQAVIDRQSLTQSVQNWSEFCRVANIIGFSTVQLNSVFIDISEESLLQAGHLELKVVAANGVDHFAAVLHAKHDKSRSLFIDLFNLDTMWNGTSRNAMSFLNALQMRKSQIDNFPQVVLGAHNSSRRFFDLEQFGFGIMEHHELQNQVFDAGFALAPMTHPRQLFRMNQYCARWVLSHLDIIALRTLALSDTDPALFTTVRDSMYFADHIIAISDFTKRDLLAYFSDLAPQLSKKISVCLEGADASLLNHAYDSSSNKIPLSLPTAHQDGYLLVMGNAYPHKQLELALAALENQNLPIVVLGKEIQGKSQIIGFASGNLTEANISSLFSRARAIIYPSAYEGYGLPVADAALFSKPIALFDTEIAREVTASMQSAHNTIFFKDFDDLADIASKMFLTTAPAQLMSELRTLEDFNNDVVDVVLNSMNQIIDLPALNRRFEYVTSLEAYTASTRLHAVPPKKTFLTLLKAPIKKILGR